MKLRGRDLFQYILGGLIVAGFFTLLYLLVMAQVPEENKEILNLVVGALVGSFASVVGYFFGSSAGSAAKSELLSKREGDIL